MSLKNMRVGHVPLPLWSECTHVGHQGVTQYFITLSIFDEPPAKFWDRKLESDEDDNINNPFHIHCFKKIAFPVVQKTLIPHL